MDKFLPPLPETRKSGSKITGYFLQFLVVCLSVGGALPLFAVVAPDYDWVWLLGCHSLSCLFCLWQALRASRLLPAQQATSVSVLVIAVAGLIPVFGPLGLSLVVLPAMSSVRNAPAELWRHTSLPPLAEGPGSPDRVGLGGAQAVSGVERWDRVGSSDTVLWDLLRFHGDSAVRLRAVSTAAGLPVKHAVGLLKFALRDTNDDVRLTAYAALDRIERRLNGQLDTYQRRYSDNRLVEDAFRVAQFHWEFYYLGVCDELLQDFYLSRTEDYLQKVLTAEDVPPGLRAEAQMLLGRVCLAQGVHHQAEPALLSAAELGVADAQLLPYLAESAFVRGDYAGVANLLSGFPSPHAGPVAEIRKFWAQTVPSPESLTAPREALWQ